jgi:predicted ATP-grasp superfamily ATP-dependent carboligase
MTAAGRRRDGSLPLRIVVTDASVKHSIAIQRALRRRFPDVVLIGHDDHRSPFPRWYGQLDRCIDDVPLEGLLGAGGFDLVLAVGGKAVRTVAALCPEQAVLPAAEQLARSYDKYACAQLAQSVGVDTPRTEIIRTVEELRARDTPLPCVVKPVSETEAKGVSYAGTPEERARAVQGWLARLGPRSHSGVLVQEVVAGEAYGLFALYDRGRPVRVFMHRRIREFPVSGGASTAARAVFDPALRDAGLRLLDALEWNGVAMVEFKRNARTGAFTLIEVNGKFWGSTELAMRAGVDFAGDLVRLFRGDRLDYEETFDRDCHFYWPLDDDLTNLWRTGRLGRVRDYWAPEANTNVGQSIRADVWKSLRTVVRLGRRDSVP